MRTFKRGNLFAPRTIVIEPHEPPGPLDARLGGEVDKGVAVGGQLVGAGQGAELFPPAEEKTKMKPWNCCSSLELGRSLLLTIF